MNRYLQVVATLATLAGAAATAQAAIINVGFETGDTTGWQTEGQVIVQSGVVHDGNSAAAIGTVDFDDDDFNDLTGEPGTEGHTQNALTQQINVAGETQLKFNYNFYSWDSFDYDQPGFEIQINGETQLALGAGDIDVDVGLDSTGWLEFSYDLTGYGSDVLDLAIYAGNTGDSLVQSWAYVDGLAAYTPADVPELNAGAAPSAIALLLFGLALMREKRAC